MKYLLSALTITSLLFACGNKTEINTPPADVPDRVSNISEPSIRTNKTISKEERDEIERYVKRRNWDMIETGTGLRYNIYEKGNEKNIQTGTKVVVDYTATLMDGTVCYDTRKEDPVLVVVDKDQTISGLHEALKYLHENDKAMIIIPSHLAYGVTGDNNKVPPLTTLIYDVEILEVQ
jgi:FKBP-type peptidyl-prolyl cis-trans isomerase